MQMAKTTLLMKKLNRVRLLNWMYFGYETLPVNQGSVLISGENAAGKSTVLDLWLFSESKLRTKFDTIKSVRYDIKGRRYIDTPSKYYFSDLGLRNAWLNFRQTEETHLMENLIYNELRLRGYSVDVGQVTLNTKNEEGKSERKNLEVDFVCNKGFDRVYVQSAFNCKQIFFFNNIWISRIMSWKDMKKYFVKS